MEALATSITWAFDRLKIEDIKVVARALKIIMYS
jgi:hypothetical protein